MKSRRVCIKTRSPPASLPLKGQVIRHKTVKWPIFESIDLAKNIISLQIKAHEVYIKPLKPRETILEIKESDDEDDEYEDKPFDEDEDNVFED